MGTKRQPGQFDCYSKAEPDEPLFTLLARDPLAPILVQLWADMRAMHCGNPEKIQEAVEVATRMEEWREAHCAPSTVKR